MHSKIAAVNGEQAFEEKVYKIVIVFGLSQKCGVHMVTLNLEKIYEMKHDVLQLLSTNTANVPMQNKFIILQWGHMSVTTSPISGNSIVVPKNFNANSIENIKLHH